MPRLYAQQSQYTLSDEGTVAELIDSRAFSNFYTVESSNQVPGGGYTGHIPESDNEQWDAEETVCQVVEQLQEQDLRLKNGASWIRP